MPSTDRLEFIAPAPRLQSDGASWVSELRRLEDRGFDTVSVSHHVTNGWQLGPIAAMAYAAASTTRLRILSLVIQNPMQHPALLAKEIATIDRLSDGRAELGIGAGWLADDYSVLGLDFEPAGTRVARFAEALDVIYDFFRGGSVDFAGAHYRVDAMEALPRCVQEPNPPILVGANGPRMLALAGRRADIVGVQTGPAELTASAVAAKIDLVRRAAADAGRPAPRIQFSCLHVHVTDSDQPPMYRSEFADVIDGLSDTLRDSPVALVGTAKECADRLRDCAQRFGIDYWHLGQDVDAASRIIEQVR